MKLLLPLIFALLSGIAMAVQGSLNSILGKIVGLLEATFIVHVIGLILVAVVIFGLKMGDGGLAKLPEVPWYAYLGGLINVFIIYGVVASIPKIGVANATTAIIVGQVTTALIIDCTGMFGLEKFPLSWTKIIGVVLLAGGAKLMLIR
ncbi:MAG: DMT family transporter [Bacillota bacterium]|jgi:transporter family-2 protein